MSKNKIRYATLFVCSCLMLVFYQNCETAKLEIAEEATISGTNTNITSESNCTEDEELTDGRCVSVKLSCGENAHMSRYFQVTDGTVEVQRYCESTLSFVNDTHEELREFECNDGNVIELETTKSGNRISVTECPEAKRSCGDKEDGQVWFQESDEQVSQDVACENGGIVENIYTQMIELRCDDGEISPTGNTEFGTLVSMGTCPDKMRNCGDRTHDSIFYINDGTVTKTRKCEGGETVKDFYYLEKQYLCFDASIESTGLERESEQPYRKTSCPEVDYTCGSHVDGEVWFQESNTKINEEVQCIVGTSERTYFQDVEYRCNKGEEVRTGKTRLGRLYKLGSCPESTCQGHSEGELFLKDIGESQQISVACANAPSAGITDDKASVEIRKHNVLSEFKCMAGKSVRTGKVQIGKDFEVITSCPEITECGVDQYLENGVCISVGVGYYSPSPSTKRVACTNAPDNSTYTSSGKGENSCSWSCDANFAPHENSCKAQVCKAGDREVCPIKNGVGSKTCTSDGLTYGSCSVSTCGVDFYKVGEACVPVGNGYYSTANSAQRVACTTGPENSIYSSDGNGKNSCSWGCSSGFSKDGNLCKKQICTPNKKSTCSVANGSGSQTCSSNGLSAGICAAVTCGTDFYKVGNSCVAVGNGYYSTSTSTARVACTTKPASSVYTTSGKGKNACAYSCNSGYSQEGNTCKKQICTPNKKSTCSVANGSGSQTCSSNGLSAGICAAVTCGTDFYKVGNSCVAVGNGYYSTSTSTARVACTTKPASSVYTTSGKGKNACAYSCNSGYSQEGNTCKKQICTPSKKSTCSVANGSGSQTCSSNGLSAGTCAAVTCGTDFYKVGNSCVAVGNGYYSTSTSTARVACTNAPANSAYSSSGKGSNSCEWGCDSEFSKEGSSCLPRYTWVNISFEQETHAAACSRIGATPTTPSTGFCASGERVAISGDGHEDINYKYGKRSYGAGTSISSKIKHCYLPDQKRDKDKTDRIMAWLCDRSGTPSTTTSPGGGGGSSGGGGGTFTDGNQSLK